MKIVSIVLLLTGLVLCPCYFVYAMMFSGSEVGEFKFVDRSTSSMSFGVFNTTSIGNDQAKKEGGIKLSPDMNPIRLIVNARYMPEVVRRNLMSRSAHFELNFYNSSDLLWTEPFQIVESSSNNNKKKATLRNNKFTSQAIKLFKVEKDSIYKLQLNQLPNQELPISDLSVQVRANVMEVDARVWGTGTGLILLSIVGFYFGSRKA